MCIAIEQKRTPRLARRRGGDRVNRANWNDDTGYTAYN